MSVRPEKPLVSIVFSFRNEERVLPELISRVRSVMQKICDAGHARAWEMVFVNDDSTDGSEQILREHTVNQSDVRVITTSRPFGVSPCSLVGMQYSTGDLVVYMDADLQDPPEVIAEMIKSWRADSDVDVVHTVRTSRSGEPRIKLWATAVAYRILKRICDVELPIEAGDFKLLSRRAVEHLVQLREHRPYLRGLVSWIGFKSTRVYYDRGPRFAGETKAPTLGVKVIRSFLDSAMISFSDIPLKITIVFGLATSALAMFYTFWIVAQKVRGHNLPGWSAMMVTMLFLGGIQLLSMGTLGLYINSMFLESKRRPNYIVKSSFGFPEDVTGLNGRDRDRSESNYVH